MSRLGSFISGAGDAVVNTAKGLQNTAKGAAWLAKPTHWDDAARGAANVGEFIVEHPTQSLAIAGKIGGQMLKDSFTTPEGLATTALMFVPGAGQAAAAGKVALAARGVSAGTKIAEGASLAAKGAKAIEATSAVVKGAEVASAGAKAAEAASIATKATKVAKGIEEGASAMRATETATKTMQMTDKLLGANPSKLMNPIKAGTTALRGKAANAILTHAGEEASVGTQVAAQLVKGTGMGMPSQVPGMSNTMYKGQQALWRGKSAVNRANQAQAFGRGAEIAADPVKAAGQVAAKQINSQTHDAAYTDRGATVESLYEPLALPAGSTPPATPYGAAPYSGGNNGGSNVPPNKPPTGGGGFGTMPPLGPQPGGGQTGGTGVNGMTSHGPTSTGGVTPGQQQQIANGGSLTAKDVADEMDRRNAKRNVSQGGRGMHFWEGPRSQWAGGIQANYDWRPVDPLRPINTGSRGRRGSGGSGSDGLGGNESAVTFSPELTKQQSIGAGEKTGNGLATISDSTNNPGQSRMPEMIEAGRTGVYGQQPPDKEQKAIGSGQKAISAGQFSRNIIDADTAQPDDFKQDSKGQGYMDFLNMGSGSNDVGLQPGTPARPGYRQGSRTLGR